MERDDPAYGGQSEYTPFFLTIYDPVVLGFFTRVVWRCPTTRLVEGYRRHVRPRHLDVGPGTGYFLERARLPEGSPVTILDPNTNVLEHASRRLQRLDITAVEADVCKPLPIIGPFDSAALNGVIHCLPGPLTRKAGAIANVAAVLAPDGVLFGASILGTLWATHLVVAEAAQRQQPAWRLRQPRGHPTGARRDPRGVVRTGGDRDCRLLRDLRGHESAHERVDRHDTITTLDSLAPPPSHCHAHEVRTFQAASRGFESRLPPPPLLADVGRLLTRLHGGLADVPIIGSGPDGTTRSVSVRT